MESRNQVHKAKEVPGARLGGRAKWLSAVFETGQSHDVSRFADLEIGDTAGLETCATGLRTQDSLVNPAVTNTMHQMTVRRVNYGVDAPDVLRNMLLAGGLAVLVGALLYITLRSHYWVLNDVAAPIFCVGLMFLLQALVMLWGSKCGKLRLRDRLIDSMNWRGDEQVLDVGCGHGLLLIAAAKRLRPGAGKAIGIDLWQNEDQADNSRAATLQNVEIENVADRVQLLDGDARKLPFADDTFDLILSSWALHNIYDEQGRAEAIREIARVLKPGGRAVIVDIRHGRDYARLFRELGMNDVKLDGPNFLFVIPTLKVRATKPLPKRSESRV